MKRTTLLLILSCVLLSFGYTLDNGNVSKIYLIDNTLIRTTPGDGIHLYDIASPNNVQEIGYIASEQSSDVAVKGEILYADRGRDLVVYDISDEKNPKLIQEISDVFSQDAMIGGGLPPGGTVGGSSGCGIFGCTEDIPVSLEATSGQGGSLARFMIVGDYLYCLDYYAINVFDIKDPIAPKQLRSVGITWGIETIFHDGEHLFIGAVDGMYIYSIENPASPQYISEFTHLRSCDPVVVNGDYAYVTLRGGSACGTNGDQLDIIDIGDITNPTLVRSVPMEGPYGLAVSDENIMICEGRYGLKVFDYQAPAELTLCKLYDEIEPFDVIWHNDLLIVTASDGFYLYNASDPCALTEYGKLF